jgi:hypothetical protein
LASDAIIEWLRRGGATPAHGASSAVPGRSVTCSALELVAQTTCLHRRAIASASHCRKLMDGEGILAHGHPPDRGRFPPGR